ncbi:carboxymuconolactone decarboxylase family protein [Streptomyces sp. CBMA29]|uniref:carboxymuconolactone decarboxylase family protein n=1 Tax=Streptomyces sp. CBMA29 TaxID=1896314 RepID=UPI00166217F0|nr:carboxymuconolactone decarboxylase family protein [Streptomyces sp. CBMA29]MBD0738392.1 hypothetical protein [Streptomyces sp. CBMA29]
MPQVNPTAAAPDALQALTELTRVSAEGLAPELAELVRLHVSQMNGCAYCTALHHDAALAAGHPPLKLAALPQWHDSPDFTPAERAALDLAQRLTRPADGAVPAAVHAEVTTLLGPEATARLIWTVATTNAWNRIGIATATRPVEAEEPCGS